MRNMIRCEHCGCWSPADLGYCRWCKPAESGRLAAVARVVARGSTPEARDMAEGDFGPGAPFAGAS